MTDMSFIVYEMDYTGDTINEDIRLRNFTDSDYDEYKKLYEDSFFEMRKSLGLPRECCKSCDEISSLSDSIFILEENGSISEQSHYFIYSCKNLSAKEIMKAKRAHWGIENSLHWILDMSFREDESRARKDYSAENFNTLRHLAYNILKSDTSFKGSFSDKQFKCMLDTAYLDMVLFSAFS